MKEVSINDILLYINDSIEVKNYIRKVVPYQYNEDMLSHLMIQVTNMKEDKVIEEYKHKRLKYLLFGVISKQMDPKCLNCFYRMYVLPSQYKQIEDFKFEDVVIEEDFRLEMIDDTLRHMKPWKVDLFNQYYKEGKKLREIAEERNMNIKTVMGWVYEVRDKVKKEI